MTCEQKVYDILRELSGMDVFDGSSTLQGDLGLDSLLMVTLILALEDELKIELDESDMNPFDLLTVDDAVKLSEKYCGGSV